MKFSQMKYERPELEVVKAKYNELIDNFKSSKTADEAFESYKQIDEYGKYVETMFSLGEIRHTLNTKDEFYSAEQGYLDETYPEVEEIHQEVSKTLLQSPFRKELEHAWGSLLFTNMEIGLKTFSPAIIKDLQEENELASSYDDLMADAEIEFDGKTLNLSEMTPYSISPDRTVRKAAANALSHWYMEQADELDNIFDKLVKVRTRIAKKLGYKSFTELGYYRMTRNCYDENMVAKFCEGILEHIVPLVTKLSEKQAEQLGVSPLTIYDFDLNFPDGNPTPKGTPDEIFEHGKKMYAELSDETSVFFNSMLENELFDVLTRPGKAIGGYMDMLTLYKIPFVFANFNGTAGDIDVLTHEAGHAYHGYVSKDVYPTELQFPPEEISEIHSMAMEFLTWPWMEGFFGEDTEKYYHNHLFEAVKFLPYGVMVDEFQHLIYDNPEMTSTERNELWLKLEKKYRPWLDMADVTFWAEGRRWQKQLHIYTDPFYYIDYCLAGVVALNFWALSQKDHKAAWAKYKKLVSFAGTKTFVELLAENDLSNPFEPGSLKHVANMVQEWFEKQK